MRLYWIIEGLANPLYTAMAAEKVRDKETGQEYKLEKFVVLKKQDAPKILAEDTGKYEFRPRIEESHTEKAELFRKRKVITKLALPLHQEEVMGSKGYWIIEGIVPPLYTDEPCDFVRSKETGKKYKRGQRKLFKDENYPLPLAEHLDKYDFIYESRGTTMTQEDYIREMWVNTTLDKKK